MVTVFKNDISREVQEQRLQEYLDAGWSERNTPNRGKKVVVDEPVVLQPTIEATPIVTSNDGDANLI